MDWATHDHRPERREPATPRLIEMCWRLQSPRGRRRILECAIYRTAGPGVEVRAGFSIDDVLRTQRAADGPAARAIADDWKAAALAKSDFIEVD